MNDVDPFAAIAEMLREADTEVRSIESLQKVASLWEKVNKLSDLAQARSRIILGCLQKHPEQKMPTWLKDALPALREEDEYLGASTRCAIESAVLLIQNMLYMTAEPMVAEVLRGPGGSVDVQWRASDRLINWLVYVPSLKFPGAHVDSYVRIGHGRSATRTMRTIFNLYDLQVQFAEVFDR